MAVTSARTTVNLKNGHFDHDNARVDKYTLADDLPAQMSELGIRSRSAPATFSYTLRRLHVDDRDQVIKFLRRYFFQDEPMNKAVKLLETPDARCLELEEYASASLEDGVSLAAVDQDGDFVAVCINGVARRENASKSDDKAEECPNPKFRRILRVLSHLDRECRMWERLPESCHTVLEVRIVSTHADWRGKGLMTIMGMESERIAQEIGAGAMRLDATSAFSAAGAERLKYKKIYSMAYADMPSWPQPDAPHLETRVYVKEL